MFLYFLLLPFLLSFLFSSTNIFCILWPRQRAVSSMSNCVLSQRNCSRMACHQSLPAYEVKDQQQGWQLTLDQQLTGQLYYTARQSGYSHAVISVSLLKEQLKDGPSSVSACLWGQTPREAGLEVDSGQTAVKRIEDRSWHVESVYWFHRPIGEFHFGGWSCYEQAMNFVSYFLGLIIIISVKWILREILLKFNSSEIVQYLLCFMIHALSSYLSSYLIFATLAPTSWKFKSWIMILVNSNTSHIYWGFDG